MHHHAELSFVDEFRWVSPLRYLKNGWQNAVLRCCMLQEGPPYLHYYCTVVLHSCILLTPVGHSSNHECHCCQLTRQWSCVWNFYRAFKVFIWLSLVYEYFFRTSQRAHFSHMRKTLRCIYRTRAPVFYELYWAHKYTVKKIFFTHTHTHINCVSCRCIDQGSCQGCLGGWMLSIR